MTLLSIAVVASMSFSTPTVSDFQCVEIGNRVTVDTSTAVTFDTIPEPTSIATPFPTDGATAKTTKIDTASTWLRFIERTTATDAGTETRTVSTRTAKEFGTVSPQFAPTVRTIQFSPQDTAFPFFTHSQTNASLSPTVTPGFSLFPRDTRSIGLTPTVDTCP